MKFSKHVSDSLGYYVYRLIDPRNGETFYIGKGKGNRVFSHANLDSDNLSIDDGSDLIDEKLSLIREIINNGLEVIPIIHRHGLDNDTALAVESALIDAYSGLSNRILGHASTDYGVMSTKQIVDLYALEEINFNELHKLILINIHETFDSHDLYRATRYAWRMNLENAKQADYVLSIYKRKVVGVFKPNNWLNATVENFPFAIEDWQGRIGFEGNEADEEIKNLYLGKRIPDKYRSYGQPIRYINI